MTTLSELEDLVILETNRPEFQAEIRSALLRATLMMHFLEFWKFDLCEKLINLGSSQYNFRISISDQLPNFRALKYLQMYGVQTYDPLTGAYTGAPIGKLDPVPADNVFDAYNSLRVNCYYTAGMQINCRTNLNSQYILAGYYARPNINPNQYSSWIADNYPYILIDAAQAIIYKMAGQDDKQKKYDNLVAQHIQLLTVSYLEEEVRA